MRWRVRLDSNCAVGAARAGVWRFLGRGDRGRAFPFRCPKKVLTREQSSPRDGVLRAERRCNVTCSSSLTTHGRPCRSIGSGLYEPWERHNSRIGWTPITVSRCQQFSLQRYCTPAILTASQKAISARSTKCPPVASNRRCRLARASLNRCINHSDAIAVAMQRNSSPNILATACLRENRSCRLLRAGRVSPDSSGRSYRACADRPANRPSRGRNRASRTAPRLSCRLPAGLRSPRRQSLPV